MPERELPAELSREELIHEIDIARARIPLVIRIGELAIERSAEVSERIRRQTEERQPELDKAFYTLRRAGLLKD